MGRGSSHPGYNMPDYPGHLDRLEKSSELPKLLG